MDIKEIKPEVFSEYAKNHILKNFFQTKEYGDLMKHSDFSVMYVGAYHKGLIVGASLILYKSIGPNMKYGYAPRGFLVDFYDEALLKMFTKKIKEYFLMKGFAFIKINPEVTYSVVNFDDKSKLVNSKSKDLVLRLKELGYDKLRDNLYFESLLPKYTPVINLPNYDFSVLDEKLINNMKDAEKAEKAIITEDFVKRTDNYNTIAKSKSKSVKKSTNPNTIKQWSKTGELINEFVSVDEASEKLDIPKRTIVNSLFRRGSKSGYYFTNPNEDFSDIKNKSKIDFSTFYCYDDKGYVCKEYHDLQEAMNDTGAKLNALKRAIFKEKKYKHLR